MGQNQSEGRSSHAFDAGGLAQGGGADALQLLADFIGKADYRAIIQTGGQSAAFVAAESQISASWRSR